MKTGRIVEAEGYGAEPCELTTDPMDSTDERSVFQWSSRDQVQISFLLILFSLLLGGFIAKESGAWTAIGFWWISALGIGRPWGRASGYRVLTNHERRLRAQEKR